MEENAQYQKFREFCKQIWNIREEPDNFCEKFKQEFSKEEIELFINKFTENTQTSVEHFGSSISKYVMSFVSDDPSIIFLTIDFTNERNVSNIRKIIEICSIELFNSLPIYNEKSSKIALNILIVVLMNDSKIQMKKDVSLLAQSTYFSVLISSGRLFDPEKFKHAQALFRTTDPFDCPVFQLPVTQIHLALALFPDLMIPFYSNDQNKLSFFLFAIFQLIVLDCSNIKLLITDLTLASVYSTFINFYLLNPSYIFTYYLHTFPKKHFTSKNIIKIEDLYSNRIEDEFNKYEQFIFTNEKKNHGSDDNLETILHFFYDEKNLKNNYYQNISYYFDSNIIHDQLPTGILHSYEDAYNLLSSKPEKISIDTLIEDAIYYPSFTHEVANIFMSKLKHKDYDSAVILANQIFKRIDDICVTWIRQLVFFPIMTALYECLNEITDEYQFEVLFFLFISFFENCTRQGDEDILNTLRKYVSIMEEPFRLFLSNFLFHSTEIFIIKSEISENKPIKKLINFLFDCKENNDFDVDVVIKYPYLILGPLIWGFKTIHPNSMKLLNIKFPKYKILKRFLVHLTSCYQIHADQSVMNSSNLIYTIRTSDSSFDLLTRFPPQEESGIRVIINQHIQQIALPKTKINQFQGIIISWRAWINVFTIEKFVIILIETLIWNEIKKFNQAENRESFILAERILANVFLNPIKTCICSSIDNQAKFNMETNQFEFNENDQLDNNNEIYINSDKALKSAAWTTLEFVDKYVGSYSDGAGLASFCLLLNISIKNDWKSEFKKAFEFCYKMIKESNWKTLKYSFAANFLYVSMSIIEVQNLIDIEMFDLDFLQMNWKFGINFFYIRSEVQRLKELKVISLD